MARAKKKRAPARRKKKAAKKPLEPFDAAAFIAATPAAMTPVTKEQALARIQRWCDKHVGPPQPTRKDAEARLPKVGSVLDIMLEGALGKITIAHFHSGYVQLEPIGKREAAVLLKDRLGYTGPMDFRPGQYVPIDDEYRLAPLVVGAGARPSYYLMRKIDRQTVIDVIYDSLPRPKAKPCEPKKMLPKRGQMMVYGKGKDKFSIERVGEAYLLGEW